MKAVNSGTKSKITEKHLVLIIVILSLLPKLFFALRSDPFYIMGDEIWTLASGAKLAGLDWSGILGGGRYYGMGFFALLAPLFKVISDTHILYKVIVAICAIVNTAIPIMVYCIVKNILNIGSKFLKVAIPVTASYLIYLPVTMVYNEHIYVVLVWLVVFLMLLLSENDKADIINKNSSKRKIVYTILLVLTLGYSLTIHARAVTLWIGVIAVVLMYKLFTKKWLVHMRSFIITCIVSYAGFSFIVNRQIDWLWNKAANQLGNTSVYRGGLENLLDPSFWKAAISIVIGQLVAGNAATGGLLIPLVIIMFILIGKGINSLRKKERVDIPNYLIITGVFAIVCCMVTIGGQAISNGPWVNQLMNNVEGTQDAARILTYLRYYFAYVPPFLITGYYYLSQNLNLVKKNFEIIITIDISLVFIWAFYIFSFVKGNLSAASPFFAFSIYGIHASEAGLLTYLPAIAVMILLSVVFYVLFKKRKVKALVIIFLIYSVYRYGYYSEYTLIAEQDRYDYINIARNSVEEYNLEEILPDTIYVLGRQDFIEGMQFLLPNHTVSVEPLNPVDKDNVVLITNYWASTDDYAKQEGMVTYDLGDDHYVYTNVSEIIDRLEKNGVNELKD
ncbi:MAG: hypothetical protein ACK5LL_12010 [Suipraeoptans sp.]